LSPTNELTHCRRRVYSEVKKRLPSRHQSPRGQLILRPSSCNFTACLTTHLQLSANFCTMAPEYGSTDLLAPGLGMDGAALADWRGFDWRPNGTTSPAEYTAFKPNNSAPRVRSLLAISTLPSPRHRFQARFADRLPAFLADAESLPSNPRQGVLNSAQELAVPFFQPDVHVRVGFAGSQIEQIPASFAGGGNRSHRTPVSREFIPLCKEKTLVVKEVRVIHACDPVVHDCCRVSTPVVSLYSQMGATATVDPFVGSSVTSSFTPR